MQNNVMYYQKEKKWEYIYYKQTTKSYPVHTHTNHVILGCVLNGMVRVVCNTKNYVYHAGEQFFIPPDIPHAIEPLKETAYSMIIVSISTEKMLEELNNKNRHLKALKQMILNEPENVFMIADMAKKVGISPYHLIRSFKNAYGLTPHQFQIQRRVRKAQKLLEEGKSVTEVAYATGFCDQSHLDRCFRKIVRLTPTEYSQSVKKLL